MKNEASRGNVRSAGRARKRGSGGAVAAGAGAVTAGAGDDATPALSVEVAAATGWGASTPSAPSSPPSNSAHGSSLAMPGGHQCRNCRQGGGGEGVYRAVRRSRAAPTGTSCGCERGQQAADRRATKGESAHGVVGRNRRSERLMRAQPGEKIMISLLVVLVAVGREGRGCTTHTITWATRQERLRAFCRRGAARPGVCVCGGGGGRWERGRWMAGRGRLSLSRGCVACAHRLTGGSVMGGTATGLHDDTMHGPRHRWWWAGRRRVHCRPLLPYVRYPLTKVRGR
jgi:hypothetical protein